MDIFETELYFKNYVRSLDLEDMVEIVFKENTVARTSCKHNKEKGSC